ncbi:UDP-glucose iridoid glucosyltransferase-like [Impatiens glandulifera]|uniref:UDP-glucose iridoid glucosyltransferase-like n=1 Tax=Impatiens glandulifera TaxID=253017 RepID=UPI001FB06703|nr:UDP-glucose iridoid glucosyltransferase-like [Impatiens glandulifera]
MEEGGEKRKQKLRIVLVPWVFQGHINPMFLLASILHEKGFSITLAHAEFTPIDPTSHPHFSFIPLPDGFSGPDVGISFGSFLNFHSAINTKIESLLLDRLGREIDDESGAEKIACIIYDTIFCNVESAAHRLGIPSVSLHTSSATCLRVHLNLPDLQSYIPIPDGFGDEIAPGLDPLRFKDLDILLAPHVQEMLPFVAKTSNVTTAAAVILNTGSCLEQASLEEIKKKCGGGGAIPVFAPGPLFKLAPSASASSSLLEENTDCLKWLDRQAPDSVIYISMGSLVRIETDEFKELAHALADSEQPFLWVVRPDLLQGEAGTTAAVIERLPEKVKRVILEEERGMVVEWAPQKEVLAHKAVGGFLSHCGWSSTVESMGEGVPMICRPGFGDQWVNARYVSAVWGAGLELGGGNRKALERGEIEAAIKKVMSGKLGEEMRKKAGDMKSKIESSIVKGGSSYNDLDSFVQFILSLQQPN